MYGVLDILDRMQRQLMTHGLFMRRAGLATKTYTHGVPIDDCLVTGIDS